jgi:hypothetical protein
MELLRQALDTYRLIVTRREATEILLLPSGAGWVLPRVEIRPQERVAEQLTAETLRAWKLETFCLFLSYSPHDETVSQGNCAVMESVRPNEKATAGTYWVPRSAASNCVDAEEGTQIRESLAELDSYTKGVKSGPFARPGWLRELFRWTEEQVTPLGLRLTGSFRQLNASPAFSLLRMETNDGAVWFKATGEPNAHELTVTLALARLFPNYLPRILGVHRGWNGWLSAEVAGLALNEIPGISAWEGAAEALGEVQISSIGKTAELLDAQCRDLRIVALLERIDPFLERMRELMALQEKPNPTPLVPTELATLAEALKDACSLLASLRLPDTLGHIDFNPGNIFVAKDQCVFLDWAEGCVTNPLLTFEYLREHFGRSGIEEPAARERLVSAYLRLWTSFFSSEELRRALEISPLLAVFAYAVANDIWRSTEIRNDAKRAGYFRSLTRRMYREAIRVAERSEPCLD